MAANEREFTLVGRFDDQITKKLKALNEEIAKFAKPLPKDNFTKSITDGLVSASKETKELQKQLGEVSKFKMNFDRSGIKAAQEDAKQLGRQIQDVSKQGFQFDRSGLKAAQEDATVLGDILKANALIKVGEGFSDALGQGVNSAIGLMHRGMQFVGQQFSEGVADQLGDIMARGSLFGSLQKEGLFKEAFQGKEGDALKDATNDMYIQTKNISRAMDGAINEVIRTSTVSSETIQILSRQLGDNLLPTLLREQKITDLSNVSREKLNEIMGGEKGVGKQLANLYSQIGSVIPSPSYASQAGMGITKFLGTGVVDRQLAIFEQNPILVDALKEGLTKFGNDVKGRIKAATYGFSIAMPEAALQEAKNTIAGGLQSISDTLTGPSGILSMKADVDKQGELTLQMMKTSGARQYEIDNFDRRQKEYLKSMREKGTAQADLDALEKKQIDDRKRFIKSLDDFYESADSPIEVLATQFGPLLQEFADMINGAGNLFIGPVNELVRTIAPSVTTLKDNFKALASDLRAFARGEGGRSLGEVLGRALGEFFKVISEYFNPEKAGKSIGDGINKFFADFAKGFKSVGGEEAMRKVMSTLQSIIMKLIFKDGNVFKGLTGLGDAIVKIFALLAAPAFISAIISGLIPLAITGMGGFIGKVLKALGEKAVSTIAARTAGEAAPVVSRSAYLAGGGGGRPIGAVIPAAEKEVGGLLSRLKNIFPEGSKMSGIIGSVEGPMARFGSFFKGFAGKFAIFGAVITSVISLFEGKGLAESLAQGAGPLLGAALGAALTPFFPPLGAFIGGWIGSLEPVTSFLTGAFQALGEVFSEVGGTIGEIFGTFVANFNDIASVITSIFPGLEGLGEGFSWLRAGIVAIKVLLFPLTATLDLVNVSLQVLRIAALQLAVWISKIPGVGGLIGGAEKWQNELDKASNRLADTVNKNANKYSWDKFSGAAAQGASSMNQVADSAANASRSLNKVQTPPGSAKPGAASGLTPTAAQMDWYNRARAQANAAISTPTPPTAAPAAVHPAAAVAPPPKINVVPLQTSVSSASSSLHSLTRSNQAAASAQNSHLQRVQISRNQQLAIEANMRATWAKVNVGSQQSLLSSASGLASAINSAAGKIRAAGSSIPGTAPTAGPTAGAKAKGHVPGQPLKGMPLAEAINYEMKNKPPGSSLVIANSSETIIPAAEGFVPQSGGILNNLGNALGRYIGPINALGKLADSLTSPFGFLGKGSLQGALSLAKSLGLIMTSYTGGKHAAGSYHYLGRAMDFGGDPGAMNRLAAALTRTGPTELIHAPGFSMKYGRFVSPGYWGAATWNNHYDHVHVAYGKGSGKPAFFSSQKEAEEWERSMAPFGSKVMSITTNTGEGLGAIAAASGFGNMFGSVGKLNLQQLTSIANSVGFTGRAASTMAAIAMAESGGNPRAHNPVPPDNSYGLWQINMLGGMGPERRRAYGLGSNEDLYDPMVNAKVAYALSARGVNFRPWSTYTNGAYRRYYSPFEHVAYALGLGRPALFSSQVAAEAWERKMIPSSLKVKSITTNSGESNFGSTSVHAPITIYQQPNQDPEHLASIVAMRIGMAIDEARNHL